jgi:hypothetical protein
MRPRQADTRFENYRLPQRHGKGPFPSGIRERNPVTVCVAVLCHYNYADKGEPDDWGLVAVTASDRMITFGDIQYEPNQQKVALFFKHKTLLLIAGDYSLHSEAIKTTQRDLADRPKATPHDIALAYGRTIQAIKRRYAEDIYLAPLGLNTDLLMAQQREMSADISDKLITQMQKFKGEDVEALVVGIEEKPSGSATIYHVDTSGSVSCADDVGFAAIGSGAWHASSYLMQSGYSNRVFYYRAISSAFIAKKAADISPGVGANFVDVNVLFRSGPERLVVEQHDKLEEIYKDYAAKRGALVSVAEQALIDFVIESGEAKENERIQGPGKDAEANGGAASDASKAARSDEGPKDENFG